MRHRIINDSSIPRAVYSQTTSRHAGWRLASSVSKRIRNQPVNEQQFRQQLSEQGYGEPQPREFSAGLDIGMHAHERSVMLLVTKGEFMLRLEDGDTVFQPGGWCELPAGTLHTERTGPNGAMTLLGYKSP